jgi:hypothetical protein
MAAIPSPQSVIILSKSVDAAFGIFHKIKLDHPINIIEGFIF